MNRRTTRIIRMISLTPNVAVIDLGSPESRIGFTILPHPEFGLLNSYRTLACGTRGTRTIEHDGTGGAELPFVLHKTEGHATLIRDCLLAKPHRIRRASICILLCIGDCRGRACDHHDNESNGAQFTHGVASLGPGVTTIEVGVCSLTHESRHSPTRLAGTLCADFVAEVGDQKSEGFGAI